MVRSMACHVILFEQQGLFFGRTAGLMSERKDGKKKSITCAKDISLYI